MSDQTTVILDSPPARANQTTLSGQLQGRWQPIARLIWIVLAVGMIIVLGISIGPRVEQLRQNGQEQAEMLQQLGLTPGFYITFYLVVGTLVLLIYCIPALLIFWRRSDNWMALLVAMTLFSIGAISSNFQWAIFTANEHNPIYYIPIDLMRALSEGLPAITLLLFPSGRAALRWLRWPTIIFLAWIFIQPFLYWTPLHPYTWPPLFTALWLLITLGGSIASQVYRYRTTSSPEQRQQTKWIVLGGALAITGFVALRIIQGVIPGLISETPTPLSMGWDLFEYGVFVLFVLPVPFAFLFSMLRYRLWDVDFYINRSLVYGLLTVTLGLVLAGGFFAIRALLSAAFGSQALILAATLPALVAGILFNPARKRLRRFVDRRFYGIALDYNRVAESYSRQEKVARHPDQVPASFGGYTGFKLLGRGGMGMVYQAQHPRLNRAVAIKILPPNVSNDKDTRKRFTREAQIVGQLRHPNIVVLHDTGEENGSLYMVMEYIEGKDLGETIKENGRMPLREALPLLGDIAAALDYAHEQGIIHRDVKPGNVMLEGVTSTGSGRTHRAVLMDFGIARITHGPGSDVTRIGAVVGTLDYIAPEQIQGAAEVDARADIYAFGVMSYQVLTGELPFKHNNPGAVVMAHLVQPVPDPRILVSDLPDSASTAIIRAMAKKPEQRFERASDLIAALSAVEVAA